MNVGDKVKVISPLSYFNNKEGIVVERENPFTQLNGWRWWVRLDHEPEMLFNAQELQSITTNDDQNHHEYTT